MVLVNPAMFKLRASIRLRVSVMQTGQMEGVGVMKDKELKLEETEASHTLGGAGEGRVQVRGSEEGVDATLLAGTL